MNPLTKLVQVPELNVAGFSFLLNLVWELWQVTLFQGIADEPHWLGVKKCMLATFGDAGIALVAFWVTAIFAGTRSWILGAHKTDIAIFLSVGVLATIIFEALAVTVFGRWTYNDAMPRLPVLGTGLAPLLQWLVIPGLVLWIVRRQIGGSQSSR